MIWAFLSLFLIGTNRVVGAFVHHPSRATIATTTANPSVTPTSIFAHENDDEQQRASASTSVGYSNESNARLSKTGRRGFLSTTGAATLAIGGLTNNLLVPPASAASPSSPSASSQQPSASPRVVLWGFGNQNKLMARYLYEKRIPVVGVVSHHDVGKDYGLLDYAPWTSINKKTGVTIVDESAAPAMLASTNANVCIMCTKSTLSDIYPALETCATNKVNVITIAEELLFSAGSSPRQTAQLDALFRTNGVSVTGSGFIDGAVCQMALALSSNMHRITGMEGTLRYDADCNGPVLAAAHGIGLTTKEFDKQIVRNKNQEKSYVYNSNEWFASALGLHVASTKEERKPITATTPVYSKAQNRTIPVGDVIGMKVVATTTTKEKVTIRAEQIGTVYSQKNEKDFTGWKFLGEPAGVSFSIDGPPTSEMTNTATISRIGQILEAEAGYVTTDKLEIARYRHWS